MPCFIIPITCIYNCYSKIKLVINLITLGMLYPNKQPNNVCKE